MLRHRPQGTGAWPQRPALNPSLSINNALVGWWPLSANGGATLADAGLYRFNGTLAGAHVVGAAPRNAGTDIVLDGTTNGIDCGSSAVLKPGAFSFSAWVSPTSLTSFQTVACDYTNPDSTTSGLRWTLRSNAGAAELYLNNGAFSTITAASFFTVGTWTHIVCTWDGTTRIIYKNGQVAATGAFSGTLITTTNPLRIGASGFATGSFERWAGGISNARMWSRALSSTEVSELYGTPLLGLALPGRRRMSFGGTAAALAATPAAVAAATGALTTAIPLLATPAAVAASTAALTTAIAFASASAALATATGGLTTAIPLASAAAALTASTGALTTSIPLAASPTALATTSAALTTSIALAASPAALATATAALTTSIPLRASSAGLSTATGALTTAIRFAAAAHAVATATGFLPKSTTPVRTSTPTPYSPPPQPIIPGGGETYVMQAMQGLAHSLSTTQRMTPQPATRAPAVPLDGMERLARAPWWPVAGQAADAWVYYDAPTTSWLFL